MTLKCGIVGLPNVGKSTLFNAITQNNKAEASNYPFCTIDPNIGTVQLKDEKIEKLAKLAQSQKIIYNSIDVVDIAGLVKNASKGEGLGNKFLSNIRDTDAIIQMVRCFEDEDIIHVNGQINPIEDIKTIELELILSDIESGEKMKGNLSKKKDPESLKKAKLLEVFLQNFASEIFASITLQDLSEDDKKLSKEFMFLTAKPIIYIANLDDVSIAKPSQNNYFNDVQNFLNDKLKNLPANQNIFYPNVIPVCSKIEAEVCMFSLEEKKEFLSALNVHDDSLSKIAKAGFAILNNITYYTVGEKETRAWTVKKNAKAPEAAGAIHTDFEKGFIKAEVVSFEDFISLGGESEARKNGKLRLEGKEYIVQDGDIMHFKFNV